MDQFIMTSDMWPVFLVSTALIISWLIYPILMGGGYSIDRHPRIKHREKACFDAAYLLGYLPSYTLRMVKVG